MMPNVVHGDRMGALLAYLADTDKDRTHNVHANPHIVAGDVSVTAWFGDGDLSGEDAAQIARILDQPRRALGVERRRGVYEKRAVGVGANDEPIWERVKVGERSLETWHCSLSLRAEEGQLSDEQWAAITQQFMDRMGFTEASGKAPARWVAIRHGLSSKGNDHVHIAASTVREDGTQVSLHMDFPRAQKIARELEREHGLQPLHEGDEPYRSQGWQRGEPEAAKRRGEAEPDRVRLTRTVRSCAAASENEAEFVRRMRGTGLLVRPRFAQGRTDVIEGYSVAVRPVDGERPIFFGAARKLSPDLSLNRLRCAWDDSPEAAMTAAEEWRRSAWNHRSTSTGREATDWRPSDWERHTTRLAKLNDRLAGVDVNDRGTWAQVARETSGALAAWAAKAHPEVAGDLAAASDALARSAQLRRQPERAPRSPSPAAGAALMVASLARSGRGITAQIALMEQVIRTVEAIVQMHRAVGEARMARAASTDVQARLARVQTQWTSAAQRAGLAPQEPRTAAPTKQHPAAPRTARDVPPSTRGRDDGFGR